MAKKKKKKSKKVVHPTKGKTKKKR